MVAKVIVDKFLAQAKDMGVPQWLAKQGMELSNLIESGFLQPQSIANKGQISSAKRMYTEALANKSFRNAQAAKLKSSGTIKTVTPVERPIITPESLQGGILTPVSGDTTSVGQSIDEMFGYSVDGVKVDGGPMFGLAMKDTVIDTSKPDLRAGWASMEDAANTKQGGIDFIAEKTGNPRVIGSYGPMTDIAMNFAAPLSQTTAKITQQIKGIPKSIIKQFDSAIREGSGKKVSKSGDVSYTRKPYPDWVGIESKDAIDQLTGIGDFPKEGAGALRKAYMAVSAAKGDSKRGYMNFRDYGIPNRSTIVNEITEPSLIGTPKGSAGFSLFDAMPNQKTVPFGDNQFNDSYDTLIAGDAKGGHGMNYPPEVYYPDMMNYLSQQVNKAGKPFSRDEQLGSFMMNPNIYQRADQQWVDGVMDYTEKETKRLADAKSGILPTVAAGAGGILAMSASDDSEAGVGSVVKRLIQAGYPESTAMKIATGELPMDKASRMARATEQGFTDKAYHVGSDAMVDKGLRGYQTTGKGILNIDPDSDGFFMSGKTPQISQSYVRGMGREPTSYPLLVNTDNMQRTDAKGMSWGSIWEPQVYGPDGQLMRDVAGYDSTDGLYDGKLLTTDRLSRETAGLGADGIVIDNVQDVGPNPMAMRHSILSTGEAPKEYLDRYGKTGGQIIAMNDGSKARSSLAAAFDPDQIDSTSILASNPAATAAAGAGGILAMSSSDDADAGVGSVLKNVFPAPQRMFNPEDKAFKPFLSEFDQQAGGRYLEMGKDGPVDITGQYPASASISVSPDGKPSFQVAGEQRTGTPPNEGRKIKTNLFKKKAGWKWTQVPEGYDPEPNGSFPIVSVEDGKNHYYTLDAQFPDGVDLARYPNSASEPRLRPTRKGKVELGEKVGEVDIRGKKHPVYGTAVIREAATGAVGLGAWAAGNEAEAGGLLSQATYPEAPSFASETGQYHEDQYGTQLGPNPNQGIIGGQQFKAQDANQWVPLAQRTAEFAEPYISGLLDGNGEYATSQGSRNRRQEQISGIMDWTPTAVVDGLREGYDAKQRGDDWEGRLYSALSALEAIPFLAAGVKPLKKVTRGLLGN